MLLCYIVLHLTNKKNSSFSIPLAKREVPEFEGVVDDTEALSGVNCKQGF